MINMPDFFYLGQFFYLVKISFASLVTIRLCLSSFMYEKKITYIPPGPYAQVLRRAQLGMKQPEGDQGEEPDMQVSRKGKGKGRGRGRGKTRTTAPKGKTKAKAKSSAKGKGKTGKVETDEQNEKEEEDDEIDGEECEEEEVQDKEEEVQDVCKAKKDGENRDLAEDKETKDTINEKALEPAGKDKPKSKLQRSKSTPALTGREMKDVKELSETS